MKKQIQLSDHFTYGLLLQFTLPSIVMMIFTSIYIPSYLIVAEKPKFSLTVVVAAGISNMVLDYLFMTVFKLGITGAALAAGLSQCVGGITPFCCDWYSRDGVPSRCDYF